MKNKNIIYITLLLIIIFGSGWYLFNLSKQMLQPVGQSPNNQNDQNIPKPPEIPKFILGSVSRTEGQNIFIKVGTEEKKIITDKKTIIIKQIKEGGVYIDVFASFSEIKSPLQIVVYYSENSGLEYRANKIQILKF